VRLADSHCHLADEVFASDLAAVVQRATAAGVASALCILSADEADEVARARSVQAAWPAVRFAAAIHPHRAGAYAAAPHEAADVTAAAIDAVTAVAVGEIGLDYHYDFAPRDVQGQVFEAQVALAGARGVPVVIHTREATDDTMAVLRQASPQVRGVMHCFTGTKEEARLALDLGLYLSFSGIVTFPRAGTLREVAAFAPLDRVLVETDAPYLAPVPYRGQRNEPAWISETARVVAEIRHMPVDALADVVSQNFADLFPASGSRVDTSAKPMV
jgi:TatD DNase family protein